MKYTVWNKYGIGGESHHRTPQAALRQARRREGQGWIVLDQDNNQWDWTGSRSEPVAIVRSYGGCP